MFFLSGHYREVIRYKAGTILNSEASKTRLSFLWWILDPILFMSVYYVMFGVLLARGTEDFVPFLLIGLVTWQWFANTVLHSSSSINNSVGLVSQINFPKVILPSINVAVDTSKFFVVFLMLLIFLWIYGFSPGLQYLWLPIVLFVHYLFIVAISYLIAALTPFIPDTQHILPHLLRMVMYLSGIIYPISIIPEEFHTLFLLNPIALIASFYRDILMYSSAPDSLSIGILAAVSLMLVGFGQWLLAKLDPIFPRIMLQR